MSDPKIICQNLGHIYSSGSVVALDNINLEIRSQEIIGVIGQNGSGKTTLVKHFNGLLKPSSGKVIVDGIDTKQAKIQELSAHVGYVFQNPNHQLFAKTVELDLEFGPTNLGLSREEVIERREKAIEFFGLKQFRDLHPYRISFPLRKLVSMAAVYTMRPGVFILDEPTTGQDNITTRTVYRLIERLREDGATVICVAHDMILLAEVVERMLVMRNAHLIADSSPREVFADMDLMHSTHITPPQITELALRWNRPSDQKRVVLSVDEMVQSIENESKSV